MSYAGLYFTCALYVCACVKRIYRRRVYKCMKYHEVHSIRSRISPDTDKRDSINVWIVAKCTFLMQSCNINDSPTISSDTAFCAHDFDFDEQKAHTMPEWKWTRFPRHCERQTLQTHIWIKFSAVVFTYIFHFGIFVDCNVFLGFRCFHSDCDLISTFSHFRWICYTKTELRPKCGMMKPIEGKVFCEAFNSLMMTSEV